VLWVALVSGRSCDGPHLDDFSTGGARRFAQLRQRATGGDDVIEQGDVTRQRRMDDKRAIEVVLAIFGAEAHLCRRRAHALGGFGANRYAEHGREGAQQFQRLVVAALADALGV